MQGTDVKQGVSLKGLGGTVVSVVISFACPVTATAFNHHQEDDIQVLLQMGFLCLAWKLSSEDELGICHMEAAICQKSQNPSSKRFTVLPKDGAKLLFVRKVALLQQRRGWKKYKTNQVSRNTASHANT